jgi:hypothetical protein
MESYAVAPNKFVLNIISDEKIVGYGFDGTTGWDMDYLGGPGLRELKGEELAMVRRGSDFYSRLNLKETFAQLTLKGTDRLEDRDVYVVEAMLAGSPNPRRFYFDVVSGLLLRLDIIPPALANMSLAQQAAVSSNSEKPFQQTYYEDYRDVDGVKAPFRVRTITPRADSMNVFTYSEIKHNVKIDESKFEKP